jgi:hypothetical protein
MLGAGNGSTEKAKTIDATYAKGVAQKTHTQIATKYRQKAIP